MIRKMIMGITEAIFPFVGNYISNKKIRKKIEQLDGLLSYVENSDAIHIKVLKEQYADTLRTKDKLEDKAKTNIVAITISITLIMSASNVLNIIYAKFPYNSLSWILFILFIAVVIYMIVAGIISIKVLINENIVYTIKLESYASGEADLRNDYDVCISANRKQNLIRNNGVYTSYECIRNALVCLFVILIMAVVPYSTKQSIEPLNTSIGSRYSIVYSSDAVKHIEENNNQTLVEAIIIDAINNGTIDDSTPIGLINESEKLFIKAGLEDHIVTIFIIEYFELN